MEHSTSLHVQAGVRLTEFRSDDRPQMVRLLNEPEIYRQTLRIPCPYRDTDAERFLGIVRASTEQYGQPIHFAIRDERGELLGGCGFDDVSCGHKAEIGYWLGRPYWGHGIMTAVVRTACRHAFDRWQLVRISAHVFDLNLASARVLEKNHFVLEGFLRRFHRKDGQFVDTRLYALVPPVSGS